MDIFDTGLMKFQQTTPYVLEYVDWVNHIRKGEAHVETGECVIFI